MSQDSDSGYIEDIPEDVAQASDNGELRDDPRICDNCENGGDKFPDEYYTEHGIEKVRLKCTECQRFSYYDRRRLEALYLRGGEQ